MVNTVNVVFFYGLFGSEELLQEFRTNLGKSFNCIVHTLPCRTSFTKKPDSNLAKITTQNDLDFLFEKVKKIKEDLPEGEILVGAAHSRGGPIMLKLQEMFMKKYGERLFDKIFLIAPSPIKGVKAFSWEGLKSYLCLKPFYWFLGKPAKRSLKDMDRATMPKDMSSSEKAELYKKFFWESGLVVLQTILFPLKINTSLDLGPITIIVGSEDEVLPIPAMKKMASMLRAKLFVIKGPHLLIVGSSCQPLTKIIKESI